MKQPGVEVFHRISADLYDAKQQGTTAIRKSIQLVTVIFLRMI